MTTHSYEEAIEASTNYFNGSSLPAKVFVDKYALRDKSNNLIELTPTDMHKRLAKELARIEAKKFAKPLSFDTIFSYLDKFHKLIPQGSIQYGMGNYDQFVTLSNCYVLDSMLDSYGGIHYADEQISQISKRRGGCGTSLDHLRPEGMITANSSRTTTGIIPFAERLSNSIREVGQNGRRGALMLTLSVHHPQILDFANVKSDTTKVTGANLSVTLTDEFLNAVQNDEMYEQRWPVDSDTPTVSKLVSAKSVWKEIIKCAHQMAEPGLLFWDNILRESPADCYDTCGFRTIGTNPCSELPLSALDSCRLLLINLMAYVRHPFSSEAYFDYKEFYDDAQIAQRILDDIIDIELEHIDRIIAKIDSDPEPEHIKQTERHIWTRVRESCFNGRRTGLGPTAVGDALAALGIKYGSDRSISEVDRIYQTLKFGSYRSSVDMAKELGPFPVWSWELEKDNPFINRIKDEHIYNGNTAIFDSDLIWNSHFGSKLVEDIQKYGRRNIANLTTAPAGSMSMMACVGNKKVYVNRDTTVEVDYFGTSSGIEPVFMLEYTRRKKVNPNDEGVKVDFVDQTGDSWQEFKVYHPALEIWMDVTGESDVTKSPWYGACAEDIDWTQRVKLQAAAQKHVDHAISSTINLPEDVSVEKVAEIYEAAWKSGCKGMTVYRKNCRTGVLIENKAEEKEVLPAHRPKQVVCDVHHVTVKSKEYFVLVGLVNDKPYEVFAGRNGFLKKKIKHGTVTRVRKGYYKAEFEDGTELVPLTAASDEHEEAMTRLISTALHQGAEVAAIVNQLEKINGDMYGFTRSIARALKKYIPDGTEVKGEVCPECSATTIIREEGCKKCSSCGFSKCM